MVDKKQLIERLRSDLGREIAVLTKAALDARELATHEEAKPENDKDTRAIEAGYLAGAQASRVRELERTSNILGTLSLRAFSDNDIAQSSALLRLEADGTTLHCFLAPAGGGRVATLDGITVRVVTPTSPLGSELLGKTQGDTAEVSTPQGLRTYAIVTID